MRTRILPRMLNDEVEEYLSRNDIIIVPVGTVEMHGGFPLDSETTYGDQRLDVQQAAHHSRCSRKAAAHAQVLQRIHRRVKTQFLFHFFHLLMDLLGSGACFPQPQRLPHQQPRPEQPLQRRMAYDM